MSVFNVDLGQITSKAEARRYAIEALQRKFRDLSAVAHALESELKFIAGLGEDVGALDGEARDLLGRDVMYHMTLAGGEARKTLSMLYGQEGSLRRVLINMGSPQE